MKLNQTCIKVSQGAFRSTLILNVYSVHARRIFTVEHRYRCQIGALALAAAAVCVFVYSTQFEVHTQITHLSRLNVVSDFLRQAETVKQSERCGVVHRPQAVAVA